MSAEIIARLEKILGRKLETGERERFLRVREILQVSDNDAIWDLLAAMEYQRIYYDALPDRIRNATAMALDDIALAAKKEMTFDQEHLAKMLHDHAARLAQTIQLKTWLAWGTVALTSLILYGSLTLWAGYCIGSGKSDPALVLKMPVGVLAGTALLTAGIYLSFFAGKAYSEGKLNFRKHALPAFACIASGLIITILALVF